MVATCRAHACYDWLSGVGNEQKDFTKFSGWEPYGGREGPLPTSDF